jgi:hypothetical protein
MFFIGMPDFTWFVPFYHGWGMRSLLSIATIMAILLIVGMANWRNLRESWITLRSLRVWRWVSLLAAIFLGGSVYIYCVSWVGLGESGISVPRGFADPRREFLPVGAVTIASLTLQTNLYHTGHGLPRQRGVAVQQVLKFTAAGKDYLVHYPGDRDLTEIQRILAAWGCRNSRSMPNSGKMNHPSR